MSEAGPLEYAQLRPAPGQALAAALGKVKREYSLVASTAVAGEYATVVETRGGTSLAQTDANRKPAAATAANGLPVATFDGTDVLVQTLESGNNGTSQWWIAGYFKPASLASAQGIYRCRTAGGASVQRLDVTVNADGSLQFLAFVSGFNGRSYTTPASLFTAGAWTFFYIQFDSSKTNEADTAGSDADAKTRIFVGTIARAITAANVGTGGTVSALLAATGTAIVGGNNDSSTPVLPILDGGQLGPRLYFGDAPLTVAELAALAGLEVPT